MKTLLAPLFILSCTYATAQTTVPINQLFAEETHTLPSQTQTDFYGGFVTNDATNYPASHGSLFGYTKSANGYGYSYQIFKGHTDPQLNIRFANYSSSTWYPWKKIFDSGNNISYEGTNVESSITGYTHLYGRASDGVLHLHAGTSSGSVFVNYYETGNISLAKGGGFVGIGTATPSDLLTLEANGNYAMMRLKRTGSNTADFKIGSGYGQLEVRNSADQIKLVVEDNGNVGIGTDAPDQKLTVDGTVRCEEVRVEMITGGPDYVFEKDYDLLSLSEVEAYINQHKHLPEVPSASEMEEEGVKLKEMNMLLLKKVEELTLHLIAMEKKIKELEQKK